MIRRFNYTERIRIKREDITLSAQEFQGKPAFSLEVRLANYSLPKNAEIFVEAYHRTHWKRFAFGTVESPILPPPEALLLTDFEDPENVLFRVKIASPSNQRTLMAEADTLRISESSTNGNTEGILNVVPKDLGDEIWKLVIDDDPTLYINKNAAPDWRQIANSPLFISLIYPNVLREILNYILKTDFRETESTEDPLGKWLYFAANLPGVDRQLPEKEDEQKCREWTDEVVEIFSKNLSLKKKFLDAWIKDGAAE